MTDRMDIPEGEDFDARGGRGRSNKKLSTRLNIKIDHVFDYKDAQALRAFITDRGKIMPRRHSGLNARQHRQLALAIKRARCIALLPFTRND